jgi:hypothetical protein
LEKVKQGLWIFEPHDPFSMEKSDRARQSRLGGSSFIASAVRVPERHPNQENDEDPADSLILLDPDTDPSKAGEDADDLRLNLVILVELVPRYSQ